MKDDFDIINYKFKEPIRVIPIADVHCGSINFNIKRWKDFKEYITSHDDIYVVIVGDLIDNQTKNSHSPFSISVIDGVAMTPFEQKKWLVNELTDLKEKILCGVSGNHETRKDNKATDQDIMYDVFCKLDIEDKYRPNMAFIKIQIGERKEYYRQTYTLGVIHGSGGGTLTGSAINRNERFGYVIDGLDCLISAHVHKPAITKPMKLVIDSKNNKVSFKPFYQVIATSWLDYGGYALAKELNPSSFMQQEIILTKNKPKELEIKIK